MAFGIEEQMAVQRVMKSGKLSGYQGNWSDAFWGGEEVKALENEWEKKFGIAHVAACNSATSGLWAACNAIGLKAGDEVIVTPYSMVCSATIPLHFGAVPVFADIEPDFFCLDPEDVKRKITSKTKAIIAVNLFGMPCDYTSLHEIAEKNGIYIIEDNAQGIGAKHNGKYAGTLGHIGIWSLNRHKHINCGEGGMVGTNDPLLAMNLHLSINHSEAVVNDMERNGETDYGNYIGLVGMNLRMTELQAAVAREQLKKLDGILEWYREQAYIFDVKVRPGCESAYYRYAFNGSEYDWDKFSEAIETGSNTKGIFNVKRHYIKPIFQMPLFKSMGYQQDQCPVCREVDEDIILAWPKIPV